MTVSLDNGAADLGRRHPEWLPWLTVIEQVLREATDTKWQGFVPGPRKAQQSRAPLLDGATLDLDPAVVAGWSHRLLRAAYESDAPKMSALDGSKRARLNTMDLFIASLRQNWQHLRETAVDLGMEADALQAVAALVPVPFLQACQRRWQPSINASWMEGYCPVCGTWPAFAEVRGIERSRYFRCGRCGGGWQAQCLFCPYCAMTDHNELVSLVPEKSGSNAVIDACKRCLGYVKTFTTLQGSAPVKVIVDDLASVDLDIAALESGYLRPVGAGYTLDVGVVTKPSLRGRIASWLT
jgi:FdhE protein